MHAAKPAIIERLFSSEVQPRLSVAHTRPEPLLGLLGLLHTGPRTRGIGYINKGGTLNTPGMHFLNQCSWAHCVMEAAGLLGLPREELLGQSEIQAIDGLTSRMV